MTGKGLRGWLLVCCLALSACERPDLSEAEQQAIRFAVASAPLSLDPRLATDATAERINQLLYRGLVTFDAAARPVPDLASWQALSARHYRFLLGDDGRQLGDGSRLLAAQVKAFYDFVLAPDKASPHRGNLAHIRRIVVLDDDRLDFFLSRDDVLFPSRLALGIAVPDQHGRLQGSGDFIRYRDKALHDIWLRRLRDGQLFRFLHVADPTVRVLKLLRGEVDMLQNDLPPEMIHYLEAQPGIRMQTRPGSSFTYLGFNLEDALTGQHKLRQAIAMAIDRRAIIQHLFAGRARAAASVLPPEHWAGIKGEEGIAYAPHKARQLLAELGYSAGRRLTISYKTSTDPVRLRIATVIRQQLAEVGIDVEIKSYDWGTFFADIKAGNFQMYSLSWVGVRSPDIFQYLFHSQSQPPVGANRGRYRSAHADALIDSALAEADEALMLDGWQRLQAQLLADLPYVPLWYEHQVFATTRGLDGYHLQADGSYVGLGTVEHTPP
ncbi:ABC transporter substrate-binding protein [Sulfuriflexus mobilis]|uniref:ABC transporter substrate-binding protein n=1 Tax=Sulfuriflexus mobilis TaxID=1811807 RepID=UPI0018D52159|nr:ABC transporter substrate-binding protein [Sulfuriflexus mobilis]